MTLEVSSAVLNLALGTAYMVIGAVFVYDLRRRDSHYGAMLAYALIAMAYTCGPHHFHHGWHLAFDPSWGPSALDTVTVLVGLPPAVVFTALVVERVGGGHGDRTIAGTPRWLAALAFGFAAYVTIAAAIAIHLAPELGTWHVVMAPNVLLVVIYAAVGYVILRTQVLARPLEGGWSLAGLSLGAVFPTCALMHASWVVDGARGAYSLDLHLLAIDWLSVPAGLFFLWVVHRMRMATLARWEEGPVATAATGTR